jgi:membrane protein YqaA with SNARE-associated domain
VPVAANFGSAGTGFGYHQTRLEGQTAMGIVLTIVRTLTALVKKTMGGPEYVAFVAMIAFALTATMTIPFGSVLAVAVLLAPRRWKSIAFWSSVGSSLGAVVIYLVVHHLGWEQFVETYPDVAASKGWQDATRWVTRWGAYALFGVAALPLPQSPALLFAGIVRLPIWEVWLAVLLGKVIKYGFYSYMVARFPARFLKRYGPLLSHAELPRS